MHPHTLNHNVPSPIFPQTRPGDTRPWSFQFRLHKSPKVGFLDCHSLIESQPLLCTPACDYEFYAPAVHPHPTLTAIRLDLHL